MAELARGALRVVLVTPGDSEPAATVQLVQGCLDGGVTAVLLRERQLDVAERGRLYDDLAARCRAAGAAALVSRDVELALACGAHGVHLGHGSAAVAEVRARAPGLAVGRSAHWPLEDEDRAADHVTLSPFRPTDRSHPRPLLTEEQVARALADPELGPVVALGGLTAADVPDLPDDLAGLAVMRALTGARDPRAAAAVLRSVADGRWQLGAPA